MATNERPPLNPPATPNSVGVYCAVEAVMIITGECIEVMREMDADSVDAIVTDPPYGLEFMGKSWDSFKQTENFDGGGYSRDNPYSRNRGTPRFYHLPLQEYQQWTTTWATEALRVLKPGGSMLCFGGTRTVHRLGVGLEDAGWQVKDTLCWLYGSGFPKAQDLGKVLDKREGAEREELPNPLAKQQTAQEKTSALNAKGATETISFPATDLARHWDGYKIGGIKPAWEPILWAVKPPEGSWTDNVLVHGVGAVNVDECRVEGELPEGRERHGGGKWSENIKQLDPDAINTMPSGRFPANLLLTHHPECDGDCHPDCPVRLLDEQSGISKSGWRDTDSQPSKSMFLGDMDYTGTHYTDTGGASRFFYSSKATDRDDYNDHPTLKPTPIIEWLIRLVTRPGHTVLDPFAGSGTTGVAAVQSGREYVLIEQDCHYVEIIERRLSEVQMGMF